MVGFMGLGYGFSLLIHATLLLVLSIMILEETGSVSLETALSFDGEEETEELDLLDTRIEVAGINEPLVAPPQFEPIEVSPVEIPIPELRPDVPAPVHAGSGEADGNEQGGGKRGFALAVPGNGKAVKKGSFTAWTIPEDPEPDTDYFIVIQIDLPEDVKRYRASDLGGLVVGDDGYEQRLPVDTRPGLRGGAYVIVRKGSLRPLRPRSFLPIRDHRAQLVIRVEGARKLVKDVITISSKLLDEKQTLNIEF